MGTERTAAENVERKEIVSFRMNRLAFSSPARKLRYGCRVPSRFHRGSGVIRNAIRYVLLLTLLVSSGVLRAQTEHFARWNGLQLHYVTYGSTGETVVLVHGWACDGTFWRDQVSPLSSHWRLVVVDLPGFGKSDKPHVGYNPIFFAKGLAAMLDDAHVQHAYVIGHSMGGSVVRQYAADHPDKVAALVIVDSRSLLQGENLSRPLKERQDLVKELYGPNAQEEERRDINRMFTSQTPVAMQQEIMSKMLSSPMYVAASAMEGLLDAVQWSRTPTNIPTLGIYRTPLSPEAIAGLHSIFQNFTLKIYEGAGHFVMMERPQEFNHDVISFLLNQEKHQP